MERNGKSNVKLMWEQMKWAMVDNPREECSSVRMGGKNSMSVCWNDEMKAATKRKEATWN